MARKKRSSSKKKLSNEQEFQIMKLVLDKFLWLGFIVMGWGVFKVLDTSMLRPGMWYVGVGALLLLLFVVIIVKEYEIVQ